MSAPQTLGVVGAGTMGAGIAQLGCAAGMRTVLHDPVAEALEKGEQGVRKGLGKWAEKGRVGAEAGELLSVAADIDGLAGCELVIEAAPERPDLKRELFERLSSVCSGDAVLASNTSSIPITSIAGAASSPERVVGMHFFNPPPLMELLEVIRADQSSDRAVEVARAAGEAMGKRVILAADGPGFLVNRCGRPFYSEALRIVQERLATPEQVDRICRLGGGFRMGPFELMDLVGIDVGFEVAKSFMELSFGEPRWKPSPLQARMVAAGRLGRKTGRGWYEYAEDGSYRPEDPEGARLIEITDQSQAEDTPGVVVEHVGDAPGGVLRRILCQLVNEAAFAIGEGVGSPEDVDTGLTLGLNHPRGPVAWGEMLGFDSVLATIDALWEYYREERYRAAPLLRRAAESGRLSE